MPKTEQLQHFNASVVLAVGDASKVIKAAPGAGKALVIRRVTVTIVTSAAQSFDVESVGGAVELIKTPTSPAAGAQFHFKSDSGFKLPDNTALSAVTSAAGNAALIVVEGYIVGAF